MAESQDPAASGAQPSSDLLAALLAARLDQFSPAQQRQLWMAAAPHRFNLPLLAAILAGSEPAEALFGQLQQRSLLQGAGGGWFAFVGHLRGHLLDRLRSEPERFRLAHRRAADYFAGLDAPGQPPLLDRRQMEYIYHLLVVDEAQGLAHIRRAFQHAAATYAWGPLERLLDYAVEQSPHLSATAQAWLTFWQARLAQYLDPQQQSEETLHSLARTTADRHLRAVVRQSLADNAVTQRRWVHALADLQAARADLQALALTEEAAGAEIALGSVYISLAETTGGLRDETIDFVNPRLRLLYRLQHAPFLLYRRLSRRYDWIPNLYFGVDYQNWTVIRFLYNARRHFLAAAQQLERLTLAGSVEAAGDSASLLLRQIRIRKADLDYRIGRWQRAATAFQALLRDPLVQQHPYLVATVELGIGRTRLRNDPGAAADLLAHSLAVFEQAGDHNMSGLAAWLLGRARAAQGDKQGAQQSYLQAASAFQRAGNLLDSTEALIAAEAMGALPTPAVVDERAEPGETSPVAPAVVQRAYVARFPRTLQSLFRKVAIFGALPLTYLLLRLLTDSLAELVTRSEVLIRALNDFTRSAPVVVDVLLVLPFLLGAPLLWLWLYEFIYALAGLVLVRLLPLHILTREQPVYFITGAEGCGFYDSQGARQTFLRWETVTYTASLDRCLWRLPWALFSRFLVGNAEQHLQIDGITSHYRMLQRDIRSHLAAHAKEKSVHQDFDYVLLEPRWLAAMVLATTALTVVAFLNWLGPQPEQWNYLLTRPPSGPVYVLYGSSVLWWFLRWFLLVAPFLALLHLTLNQRSIKRTLGERAPLLYYWTTHVALVAFLLLILLDIWLLTL